MWFIVGKYVRINNTVAGGSNNDLMLPFWLRFNLWILFIYKLSFIIIFQCNDLVNDHVDMVYGFLERGYTSEQVCEVWIFLSTIPAMVILKDHFNFERFSCAGEFLNNRHFHGSSANWCCVTPRLISISFQVDLRKNHIRSTNLQLN